MPTKNQVLFYLFLLEENVELISNILPGIHGTPSCTN